MNRRPTRPPAAAGAGAVREGRRPAFGALATVGFLAAAAAAAPALAQTTNDPFPEPIETEVGLAVVDVVELASLPDADGQFPDSARPARLHEPITLSSGTGAAHHPPVPTPSPGSLTPPPRQVHLSAGPGNGV